MIDVHTYSDNDSRTDSDTDNDRQQWTIDKHDRWW
jgi:hypothetical protein